MVKIVNGNIVQDDTVQPSAACSLMLAHRSVRFAHTLSMAMLIVGLLLYLLVGLSIQLSAIWAVLAVMLARKGG